MPYTARDAIAAATVLIVTLAIAATHLAIARRRDQRRRLLERRARTGRYDTGCPPEITKRDVDAVEIAYLEAKYPQHYAAGCALAQLNETIAEVARTLMCGYAIRKRESSHV